jgi:hypothetical protein
LSLRIGGCLFVVGARRKEVKVGSKAWRFIRNRLVRGVGERGNHRIISE